MHLFNTLKQGKAMCYSSYHTGHNPLERCYRSSTYLVTRMCRGAWVYIMDDFGNAVELPH